MQCGDRHYWPLATRYGRSICRPTLAGAPYATTDAAGHARDDRAGSDDGVAADRRQGRRSPRLPSQTLSSIVTGAPNSQPSRRWAGSTGCPAVSSWTRRGELAERADRDRRDVEQDAVVVDEGVRADADVRSESQRSVGRITTPSPIEPSSDRRISSRSACSVCAVALVLLGQSLGARISSRISGSSAT